MCLNQVTVTVRPKPNSTSPSPFYQTLGLQLIVLSPLRPLRNVEGGRRFSIHVAAFSRKIESATHGLFRV